MGRGSAFRRFAVLAPLLIVVALSGVGCGGPRPNAAAFVGKWQDEKPKDNEIVLDLRSDGTGTSILRWYPHQEAIRWSLVGDKLIISSMDGTGTTEYQYQLSGTDKLVLMIDGKQRALVKVK